MTQLQLQQKALELDSKEELLNKREALVKEAENRIAEIDAKLELKEKNLETLDKRYAETEKSLDEMMEQKRLKTRSLEEEISIKQDNIAILGKTYDDLNQNSINKRKEIKKLNDEIEERHKYVVEQEKEIARAMTLGNERILELKDISGDIEDQINTLNLDKIKLNQIIDEKNIEILNIDKELTIIKKELESQQLINKAQIKQIHDEIAEAEERLADVTQETTDKLRQLSEKETSLLIRFDELHKEQQELDTKKRRFNSAQSLYN